MNGEDMSEVGIFYSCHSIGLANTSPMIVMHGIVQQTPLLEVVARTPKLSLLDLVSSTSGRESLSTSWKRMISESM
jgi:hypothetical protein